MATITKINAVNELLVSIGYAPVNSLITSTNGVIAEVSQAVREIEYGASKLQLEEWWFNVDDDYPLIPNADGLIMAPTGAVSTNPTDPAVDLVLRRETTSGVMCLYDKANRTFQFAAPVKCKVIWSFGFDDLPEAAKQWVMISSCRRFQSKINGSSELDRFNAEDEARAWQLILDEDNASDDTNIYRQNALFRRRRG